MHIAVTGNIGAGKTTLTNMLAKHYYSWENSLKDVDHNPYLDDFIKICLSGLLRCKYTFRK